MKKFIVLISFFIIMISLASSISAHSGCCSHHGGVAGCQCGDGTSLSDTCRPYYPECNGNSQATTLYTAPSNTPILLPTKIPTKKIIPRRIPTKRVVKPIKKPTPTPTKKINKKR